ncbi:MAG: mechanosensitive ion channel family protein [Opitutaceae bacterium]
MNIRLPEFHLPSLDWFIATALGVAVILIGAFVLRFVLHRSLGFIARRSLLSHSDILPLRKMVTWLVAIVALVLILGVFGVQLPGIWAVLSTILAMIAIGFVAVWSVLSNISCTFMILFFRPFSIGDEIEFAGEQVKGRVVDLNFLFTTLQTEDQALLQIPNNMFFQKALKRRRGQAAVSLADQLNRPGAES